MTLARPEVGNDEHTGPPVEGCLSVPLRRGLSGPADRWNSDAGEKSSRKLGVDQIDLLILHQALPSAFDRTLGAYRALEKLLADGGVHAIGVSNFMVDHLTALLEQATVVPVPR